MLKIVIEPTELFDDDKQEFVNINKEVIINLEHSLVSISKWEQKYRVPFLDTTKTTEQTIEYIKCMTISQNIPDEVYYCLSSKNIELITQYIDTEQTATTVRKTKNRLKNRDVITSELVYYWMIQYQIPFECQKWHFSRLLMLIQVCAIKNNKEEKMSPNEVRNQYKSLNDERLKKYKTTG